MKWNCRKLSLLSCLLISGLVPSVAMDSVDSILDKYIRAVGIRSREMRAEFKKGVLQRGSAGQVPLETVSESGGRWRYHQDFAWGDQVNFGCDGIKAWVQDTKAIAAMDPRQRLDLQLLLDPDAPSKMRELYPDLKLSGSGNVGDKKAVVLLGISKEGFQTELSFDRETGLLLRAGEILLEDYRETDGVKRPFKVLFGKDSEEHLRMAWQFSEIRHSVDAEDSLFEVPCCVLPVQEPVLYTRRFPVKISVEAMDACAGKYRLLSRPEVVYEVTRQKDHLMIYRQGWPRRFEIKPESEVDYFVHFLNWDFHFEKDASGKVTNLEIGKDRAARAEKFE